ncbi:hypothetical protein EPUS_05613 [Endocarpon pusillum Z07020]|uniref:non-specific serine/threonine protein kinase n=1 Tax=Endocarpon pusillum (strain Z07020 / HMAS-L-300199) TaxID=1263415 RepID=U1HHX9_ENDPU|nr:uncharacterized protein EPUS_05613 [Endocarpon pusillum Z07020]ERF68474.1 hypothetical protein EPUS_05613 [Endocarpon pusillum Z07020]
MAEDPLSDNYQMLEELGSGSFGTVYKAIEKATGEIVAVKHIDLESTDEDLQEVQAEISLLSTCASPFVTQYKASFLRGYKLWIVMEYLGGGSCQDLLKPGVFSEAHIAIVCQQILLGLQYLHQEGKLHRDIKAANILLSQSGKVKLADFGVAAQLVNIRSLRNTFVGTPFWMAPEVIQQSGYDFKADIWSLGITAMELIHGEPPNAGKHPMKVLMEIPKMPAPRLEGSQYSKDFKDFVAKCLVKDPDQRPSAKELLKHKFIRNAGRTEALQELILRRQEWEAGLEKKEALKYYAETLRNVRLPIQGGEEEDDEWVFDTVKALPTLHHTQKRRKLTTTEIGDEVKAGNYKEETMKEVKRTQHPQPSTMKRLSSPLLPPSSSSSVNRSSTKKRISSGQQKQPLGVNMSFGNSPSTIRQFRRVSPAAIENDDYPKDKDSAATPSPSSLSPSKIRNTAQSTASSLSIADSENVPPLPPARHTSRMHSGSNGSTPDTSMTQNTVTTSSPPSITASQSISPVPVPFGLAHYLRIHAINPSIQEIFTRTTTATSGDSNKQAVLSHLMEAFSELESVDPEALLQVFGGIMRRVGRDERLRDLLEDDTGRTSPQQVSASGAGAGAKLVLAQNNPHLKSHHRRRQSAIVQGQSHAEQQKFAGVGQRAEIMSKDPSSARSFGKGREGKVTRGEDEEEKEDKERGIDLEQMKELRPGREEESENGNTKGMEHVTLLGDVLFERWCEGLRARWSGNSGVV